MLKSMKRVIAAAVVLAIPAFAVCGLMAGPSTPAQLASDLHFFDPIPRGGVQAPSSGVEEIDLANWISTWGSSKVPPPPINPHT